MQQIVDNPLVAFYSLVYIIAFRDAIKIAAGWGAFEASSRSLLVTKVLGRSAPILILLPILVYVISAKLLAGLSVGTANLKYWLSMYALACLLVPTLGVFPFVTKNIWSIVAQRRIAKGRNPGQLGEGWINSSIADPRAELPTISYSCQMIFVLSVVPFIITIILAHEGCLTLLHFTRKDGINLITALYLSEFPVLFHMAKLRKFYYSTSAPKWFLNMRNMWTFPLTIFAPILFGFFWFLLAVRIDSEASFVRRCLMVSVLLLGLPFPYYCNQSMLLAARRYQWVSREERPEVWEGSSGIWRKFLALAILSIILMCITYYMEPNVWNPLHGNLK